MLRTRVARSPNNPVTRGNMHSWMRGQLTALMVRVSHVSSLHIRLRLLKLLYKEHKTFSKSVTLKSIWGEKEREKKVETQVQTTHRFVQWSNLKIVFLCWYFVIVSLIWSHFLMASYFLYKFNTWRYNEAVNCWCFVLDSDWLGVIQSLCKNILHKLSPELIYPHI